MKHICRECGKEYDSNDLEGERLDVGSCYHCVLVSLGQDKKPPYDPDSWRS